MLTGDEWEDVTTARAALAVAVAVLGTTLAGVGSAAPPPSYRKALAGDFDGDGRTDLFRPGAGSAHEVLMFAQPDGSFAVEEVPLDGTFTQLVGDYDGDGRDDVFHFSVTGPDAIWFGGADRGMTRVSVSASTTATPVVGDFDGDGRADVYWAAPGNGRDSVWYGEATRRFTSHTVSGGTGVPVAGDYDGDTRTDLLWVGRERIWYATGSRGVFSSVTADAPAGRTPYVGDFDGDRTDDVFWYAASRTDYVDYGTVARVSHRMPVSAAGSFRIAVGDYDGDLVDDLLLSGSGDRVWYGTRAMTFSSVTVSTKAVSRPVAGDFDADGRADLFWPDTGRVWRGGVQRQFASSSARIVPNRVPALTRTTYRPYGYVAHAMGPIDGHVYTNSREAFESSYAAGFRLFETDLVMLGDGNVIAAHDRVEHWLGLKKNFRDLTLPEVRNRKWMGKYRLLTGDDLIALLARYRDVYFILDTKWSHSEIVGWMMRRAVDPQVARRILPHVEGERDLAAMRRYYPVQNYVLALYRTQSRGKFDDPEVLAFVRKHGTPAVMMWLNLRDRKKSLAGNAPGRQRYTPEFDAALRRAGAVTFVHSTPDPDRMGEFEAKGVGVYSDGAFGPLVPPVTSLAGMPGDPAFAEGT